MKTHFENMLSRSALRLLRTKNHDQPFLTPAILSQITTFNRQVDQIELSQVEGDSLTRGRGSGFLQMKQDISNAIDRLETAVGNVIDSRRSEEKQAKRWITVVGCVLVLLVIGSALMPLLKVGISSSWITIMMSGISVAGLLYILYSPVAKLIEIANDRSGLMLLPTTYRLRVLSASSQKELSIIAKELYDALQQPMDKA